MKVLVIKQTMAMGKVVEPKDEPQDFPKEIAIQLITAQKAIPVPEPPKVVNREKDLEKKVMTRDDQGSGDNPDEKDTAGKGKKAK